MADAKITFLLRLADDNLILGHRLSEWCGHAPMLEEDLAMPNMALDLIGHARTLYAYAAELEGTGRSEDDLAFLRREREYLNCLMVERPNGDFAHTMLRQFYFAAFMQPLWAALAKSHDATLAAIAAKAEKEVAYHIRHTGEWVIRLGDGTPESAARLKAAAEILAPYVEELFERDAVLDAMIAEGVAPDPQSLRPQFEHTLQSVFSQALLDAPAAPFAHTGGRTGQHGEHMGFLLTELQYMQRAYPGAEW
ncbi:phenylacetate-CoA oxygenase subunit PaaC [Mesorhizobium sp. NBSH29]|uniref:1,2-phenylacetyl-CoA epoxidase subunit PaaC n=1 Tax=Mesorhizobium sp. NBSH29 TaxID=2654249 RepID=UPI00189679C0|nr:1,2-phenylacetyl-CoA epoxidase subunit PaaC [Mesorhizobium sp. NBSH29]QPC88249.1 phenylacetate-CoA oxygenase subunit PaaC [Mesorhizobium sp. NBSH29]